MATYRPGHTFLRFGIDLLFSNLALLVGLLSKAYFDALDGARLGLAASPRSGLAALPIATLVILLALEGLADVGMTIEEHYFRVRLSYVILSSGEEVTQEVSISRADAAGVLGVR